MRKLTGADEDNIKLIKDMYKQTQLDKYRKMYIKLLQEKSKVINYVKSGRESFAENIAWQKLSDIIDCRES